MKEIIPSVIMGFLIRINSCYAYIETRFNFFPSSLTANSIFLTWSTDGYLFPVAYCLNKLGFKLADSANEVIFISLNSLKKACKS